MTKKLSLLQLFWIFFKIGLVLFGGGYAILPFLKAEMVDKAKICTMEEITDYYALSQCFPGLVAGNVSMLTGYKARGIPGSLAAVTGVCMPAFLAIVIVFSFLSAIMGFPLIENIFEVLDLAVCVLILLTVLELWEFSVFDKTTTVLFLAALTASIMNVSPFIIVICAGIIGVLRHFLFPKAKTCCPCAMKAKEAEDKDE